MTVDRAGPAAPIAAWGAGETPRNASPAGSAEASIDRLANKEVFLQLLVAQIRHQNPLKPAEGTEFVAQLAQFTQLELTLGIRKDLEQIRAALAAAGAGGIHGPDSQPEGRQGVP